MIALQYIIHRKTCKTTMTRKARRSQYDMSKLSNWSVIKWWKLLKHLFKFQQKKKKFPETPVGHSAISCSVSALQSHKSHCWNDLSNGLRLAGNVEIILFKTDFIHKFDQVVTYDYKSKENICKILKIALKWNIWKLNSVPKNKKTPNW